MQNPGFTKHFNIRSQQRSLRFYGIEMVLNYGTYSAEDSIVMTRRDIQERIDENNAEIAEYNEWLITKEIEQRILCLKNENERLRKLNNVRLIIRDDVVVTAYRMTRRKQRKSRVHLREAFH